MKKHLLIIFTFLLTSCNPEEIDSEKRGYKLVGDTILVDNQSTIATKLKVETIQETPHQLELLSAGKVKAISNYYAEIAPPFSGRVTKVHLKLGMKTLPGTPLFEMVSPEFMEIQKEFFQSKSELYATRISLKRQQDLQNNGVGTQRDLEEAETNFQIKKKDHENTVAALKVYGVNLNKIVLGQALIIKSPISGEVIHHEIILGHYIKADDEPRAKIAQLNKVWVVGEVKEKDIRFIHELDEAEISVAAYPEKKIKGKVFHIEKIVDEETRSIKVLMECDNTDQLLKPGMYASVKYINRPTPTLFVPAKAVLQFNDKSFVFVQVSKGKYMRKFIETGITKDDKIAVTSGLKNNDLIISEGAFYLLEAK